MTTKPAAVRSSTLARSDPRYELGRVASAPAVIVAAVPGMMAGQGLNQDCNVHRVDDRIIRAPFD